MTSVHSVTHGNTSEVGIHGGEVLGQLSPVLIPATVITPGAIISPGEMREQTTSPWSWGCWDSPRCSCLVTWRDPCINDKTAHFQNLLTCLSRSSKCRSWISRLLRPYKKQMCFMYPLERRYVGRDLLLIVLFFLYDNSSFLTLL